MTKIAGWQKLSMLDWPGKLSTILFLPGCNYKCPTCHSAGLVYGKTEPIPEADVLSYLKERDTRKWLNGIVISGGEPLVQDLRGFLREIKKIKLVDASGLEKDESYGIKLFTNGRDYRRLGELKGLVDAVSMDIKGVPGKYREATGLKEEDKFDMRDDVEKGVGIVQLFPEHEFRTTMVPVFDGKWKWWNNQEIDDLAMWAKGLDLYGGWKWIIQPFHSREKGVMLDDRFAVENLPLEFQRTPDSKLEEARKIIAGYGFKT